MLLERNVSGRKCFRQNALVKTILVLAVLLCLAGCSPQKNLANRLKGTDRVIVTNTVEHLSISITGDEVDNILKAFASGKKESPLIDAAVGLRLEFYKGAANLGKVETSGQVFWIGKTPYSDRTETLNGLYRRLREETDLKGR
jgi:hypothetical protein